MGMGAGVVLVALGAGFFGACGDGFHGDVDAIAPAVKLVDPSVPAPGEASVDARSEASVDGGTTLPDGGQKSLRLMTYNVKHGERLGLEAVADVIKRQAPDLVGLQEVDVEAGRSGGVDQAHRLGQLTGMTSLFRTAFSFADGGSYGVALLSRYPVLTSDRVLLPSSGEQRVLATVDVELGPGKILKVGITHLDLVQASRTLQVAEVKRVLSAVPRSILFGDMNASPDEAAIVELSGFMQDAWARADSGPGNTIPVDVPNRRIDYIFLGSGIAKPTFVEVPDERAASDHRPVVAHVPSP